MDTINYKDKEVKIYDNNNWTYINTHAEDLKEINNELYQAVQKEVDYFIKNKIQIKKEKQEKQDKILIEKRTELQNKFKENLYKEYEYLLEEFKFEFGKVNKHPWFSEKEFKIQHLETKCYYNIDYSESKWNFPDNNYRRRYYTKLDNAIKKAVKLIQEKIESIKERQIKERDLNIKKDKLKKFAESKGFKFDEQRTQRRSYNNHHYIYSTYYYMTKNNIIAELNYDKDNDVIQIINIKFKGLIDLKDFKELIEKYEKNV